jgi:hypothetical protein
LCRVERILQLSSVTEEPSSALPGTFSHLLRKQAKDQNSFWTNVPSPVRRMGEVERSSDEGSLCSVERILQLSWLNEEPSSALSGTFSHLLRKRAKGNGLGAVLRCCGFVAHEACSDVVRDLFPRSLFCVAEAAAAG